MSKKTIPIISFAVIALLIVIFAFSQKDHPAIEAFGNQFEIGSLDEFETGVEFNNVVTTDRVSDGALELKAIDGKYSSDGYYISQEIDVPNFRAMVASWNSDTPPGTYVEVEARALVNHFNDKEEAVQTWSDWLSWGKWSPFVERASSSAGKELAGISIDEFLIYGSKGETASKVQLKVNLHTDDPSVTPVVRFLHGSLKNSLSGQTIEKVFKEEVDTENLNKNIAAPKLSQMIRDPKTANSICSPTTIVMMMNAMGEGLLPEEVAQNTYDYNYGFGNWAFAAASLGSYGYKSYVDYSDIEGLKQEIAKGYPVGVSVKYTNDLFDGTGYPLVDGAPGATGGHIILVTGFETIDDVEYVLVNDSYAPDNETVARKYKLKQFDKAWQTRIAYVIRDKEENAGLYHTERIEAKLVESNEPGEYQVFVGDENINIQNFGGSIAYTTNDSLESDQVSYKYPIVTSNNSLKFTEEELKNPDFKLYIITDSGYVYVATE